jgi:aerobic-type carbon monoxide dehydrogenase small subunit (CoxS/CutS family)
VNVTVDGNPCALGAVAPSLPLALWMRDSLGVTSVKIGCAEGSCGACVALVDGVALPTCLLPVARVHGAVIDTAAVVATRPPGEVLARRLVSEGGLQCGFCTPGLLCGAVGLLQRSSRPTRAEIRQELAGHLCRCTGYAGIVRAVEAALDEMAVA